ncbi:NADH:flavin oxidoreductase/NADH oxidase [Paenibacillus lautus]|uniref:NADH:flavin oxidoreductase/NADH oxidase n=1 Tax=Paenibacillus lautus TaxID=1401 RepID=UPI003D2B85E2
MLTVAGILEPIRMRDVELRNRIGLAPMTTYCANNGELSEWHFVHYGARAHGTGLVIVEATAVSRDSRVTPHDLGIWNDDFISPFKRLTRYVEEQGAVCGIQLSHGGRKASRTRPHDGDLWLKPQEGGWEVFGPSAIPFSDSYPTPLELTITQIEQIKRDFVDSAVRAHKAGFKFIELHAGHGRLFHTFYSPISNQRNDNYGGSFENRIRLLIEVVKEIRCVWPPEYPLGVRLSCVDWVENGWSLEDSVLLSGYLKKYGVDLIDCTSAGIIRPLKKDVYAGYQVPFAREIRKKANVMTAAVGLINSVGQANEIIENEDADLVLFGRKMLFNPQFALEIANELKGNNGMIPFQYQRAYQSMGMRAAELIPEL